MFTFAVEEKTLSCDVRALVPVGFSVANGEGYGLREGYMGSYDFTEHVIIIPYPIVGGFWRLEFSPERDDRNKRYELALEGLDYKGDYQVWREGLNVQASFGLYYGLRAGINLPETLDFLLGWATVDIMVDD